MADEKSRITPVPVVLFCYNRPRHLKLTIQSLKENAGAQETTLFVFSDGPRNHKDRPAVDAVHEIISGISGFAEVRITKNDRNEGLAASVINGVSRVLELYEACIVLEDDLEVSPYFLTFMNKALSAYASDYQIFSVSGYCPPIAIPRDFGFEAFRFPRINSWGWGTWRDRWRKVDWEVQDFDVFIQNRKKNKQLERQGKDLPVMLLKQQTGKTNSWAVRFNQGCFNAGMTNVYPVRSLVRNTGADNTGTNMTASRKFSVALADHMPEPSPAGDDERINSAFQRFFNPSIFRQTINFFKINFYRFSRKSFHFL
ncbi:MAG: glycosyltransferase [Marinilabilia sp.]